LITKEENTEMTTMTLAPAPACAPIRCQPWCTTGHDNQLDQHCIADMGDHAYVYLSQHTDMGSYGVGPDEINLGMIHDHDANLTIVELITPGKSTDLTIDEARELHATLGRLLAMANGGA
jgi:hypothetical protein